MKFLLAAFAVSSVFAISDRHAQASEGEESSIFSWNFSSDDCCKANNYIICGTFKKDCCNASDCDKGWFGSRHCPDKTFVSDTTLQPRCKTCHDVCEKKSGAQVCSNGITSGKTTCCAPEDCEGTVDHTCKAGTEFNLGQCLEESTANKFFRKIKTVTG